MEQGLFIFFGLILFLLTLPGSLELLLLTIGALFYSKKNAYPEELPFPEEPKIVILIPAHNEEIHLPKTIVSLQQCTGKFDLIVIADNCTDQTVKIAEDLHVRVLERNNLEKPGKPHALQFAFENLLVEGYDIFVVIDADTIIVKSNLITEVQQAYQYGALAMQARDTLVDSDIPFQRLSRLAFSGCSILRPRGREAWKCSAGIMGNGFAITRTILLTVPFCVDTIIEDVAYHLKIVKAGYKVHFLDDAEVLSVHAPTIQASSEQKSRWEGGRWQLLKESFPWVIREIGKGKKQLIEPLMDLLLLPLSFHTFLLLLLLFIPLTLLRIYALLGLGTILLYIFVTIKITDGGWKEIKALFLAPFYLLWKFSFIPQIIHSAQKNFKWTRTKR